MIPQNILDDILDRCNIAELISGYIPLKRIGRSFKALCPFHHEKTPSFIVNPDKQIYHCFGCGVGGNAFSFLMKYERMDFIEAVKLLAKKTGVVVPDTRGPSSAQSSFISQLHKVNEFAASYYTDTLLNKQSGKQALDLVNKRNISKESILTFKLGYSINSWDGLLRHAKEKGVSTELLNKAGLILRSNRDNSFYDRFRNRLIFPIFDIKGKVIAFGARVLDKSLPKYINSPETPVYMKGRHLYGLNFAKISIAQENHVIIVEGYTDLISCYQKGIKNIVASCGTALTIEQTRLLKRFTNEAIMIYDADQAGETASLRNLDVLISEGMDVRIVSLPTGQDPDSYINKVGASGFKKALEAAKDLFSYKLGLLLMKYKKSTPEGKSKIVSEMLPTLWRIQNAVLKSGYLKRLAQDLDIDESALKIELGKVRGDYTYYYEKDSVKPDMKRVVKSAEKILVSLMLDDIGFIEEVKGELSNENFQDVNIRKIIKALYDFYSEGKEITPTKIMNYLNDEASSEIISELASDAHSYTDKEKNLHDCINWIKQNSKKDRLKTLQDQIHMAQVNGDQLQLQELVALYNTLIKTNKG